MKRKLKLLWIVLTSSSYSYLAAVIALSRVEGWGTLLGSEIEREDTLRAHIIVRRAFDDTLEIQHFELGK